MMMIHLDPVDSSHKIIVDHRGVVMDHKGMVMEHKDKGVEHEDEVVDHEGKVVDHEDVVVGHEDEVVGHEDEVVEHEGGVADHKGMAAEKEGMMDKIKKRPPVIVLPIVMGMRKGNQYNYPFTLLYMHVCTNIAIILMLGSGSGQYISESLIPIVLHQRNYLALNAHQAQHQEQNKRNHL